MSPPCNAHARIRSFTCRVCAFSVPCTLGRVAVLQTPAQHLEARLVTDALEGRHAQAVVDAVVVGTGGAEIRGTVGLRAWPVHVLRTLQTRLAAHCTSVRPRHTELARTPARVSRRAEAGKRLAELE